jgi:S-(hydroxymethyl)glutathione dehydrogenase/alcohol dehydrogenase
VHEASCIKIEPDLPMDKACLVGCGVTTGWGSAVYAAAVRPGDNVAIVGIGGIGINAVQGARLAGAERIFAIDPVEFKRDQAKKFGATHTIASLEEATAVIGEETWGRMCSKVIVTMGVGRGELLAPILGITSKLGRVVITNITPWTEVQVSMSLLDLTLMEKQVVGSLFGSANPRADVPRLLELYRAGQLDLDGLVTRTYKLEDVNQGYADMRDGKNLRGVLIYE